MKLFFGGLFLFMYCAGYCQIQDSTKLTQNGFKSLYTFGYIDGIRLDSLPVKYIQVDMPTFTTYTTSGNLVLSYGQTADRYKQLLVADQKGKAIFYAELSVAFVLNYLDYNGWELVSLHYDTYNHNPEIILKKKTGTD